MAKGHSYLWRRPGRRDEERKQFAALMLRVEAVRIRRGMSKTELATELGTTKDALRAWMTGRTVGRKGALSSQQKDSNMADFFAPFKGYLARSRKFRHYRGRA